MAVMRILFVGRYHSATMMQKLLYMSQAPDLTLRLIAPSTWHDSFYAAPRNAEASSPGGLTNSTVTENGVADEARFSRRTVPLWGKSTEYHRAVYGSFFREMRTFAPDIVHVEEEPDSLTGLQLATLRRLWAPRAKLLLHTWQNIERNMPRAARWVMQRSLAASDGLFCANQAAIDLLRRQGYSKPLWLIPAMGVDADRFTPCAVRPDLRPFTVGYIGRLAPEKGIDLLLNAFAELGRSLPPDHLPLEHLQLHLIGNGPQRAALMQQAEALGIARQVVFMAGMPPDAIVQAMCKLHVLVLPSRGTPVWQEQLGRVLVEAMAAQVPVIGSSSGAIPEVIGDAGLIFPEDDVAALTAAMAKLYHDPNLAARLAQAGHGRANAEYSQRVLAERTVAVYRSLL